MNFRMALGFTVAVVAVFCVIVMALVRDTAIYEAYHRVVGLAMAAQGAVLFLIGVWRHRYSGRSPLPPPSVKEAGEGGGPREGSLLNLRYFGFITLLLGLVTVFILPRQQRQVVRAAEPPAGPAATVPEHAKVVEFPTVRVQGIFYRPDRPSVLINSRTFFVGDWLDKQLKVVVITRDSATLEMSGERRVFPLEK